MDFRLYKDSLAHIFIVATGPWPEGKGKSSLGFLVQRWECVSRVLQADSQTRYEIGSGHDKCIGDFSALYNMIKW